MNDNIQLEITPNALLRLVKSQAISLNEFRCFDHKTKMLLWREYLRGICNKGNPVN